MEFFEGPVTSCAFIKGGTWVSGKGNTLRDSCDLSLPLRLPRGAVIHGIRGTKGQLLFGGRYLAYQSSSLYSEMFTEAILDAIILRENHLLLAFSSGKICTLNTSSGISTIHWSPNCPRQYLSMRMSQFRNELLVAGGSVMGAMHVWDCSHRNSSREVSVLTGHQGAIFSLKFSFDHSLLLSAGEDRTTRLWKRRCIGQGGTCDFDLAWTSFGAARVWDCVFCSPALVASVGEDNMLRVCRVSNGALVYNHTFGSRNWYCLDVKNDLLMVGGFAGKVCQVDLATALLGEVSSNTLSSIVEKKSSKLITALCSTEISTLFAVNSKWELLTYKLGFPSNWISLHHLRAKGICKQVLYLGISRRLVLGTALGDVYCIELDGSLCWHRSGEHFREITAMACAAAAQSEFLVTCSGDGLVVFRDSTQSGQKLAEATKLPTAKSHPMCACFLNPHLVAMGDSFGNVFILNKDQIISRFFHCHGLMAVTCIVVSNNGFITGGRNGVVLRFSQEKDEKYVVTDLQNKLGGMTQVEWISQNENNSLSILGTFGEKLLIWDEIQLRLETTKFKRPFCYLPNVGVMFAGDNGQVEWTRQASLGRAVFSENRLSGHSKMIWASLCIDSDWLVTVSEDETIRLWRVSDMTCICVVETPQIAVRGICALPDSRFAICGAGGLVQVYLLSSTDQKMHLVSEHRPAGSEVRLLCLDAWKGSFIVTGGSDGVVSLYSLVPTDFSLREKEDLSRNLLLPQGNKLRSILPTTSELHMEHKFGTGKRAILCLQVILSCVLLGETDGSLRVWDLVSRTCLKEFQIHGLGTGINCFHAVQTEDGNFHVWTGGDDQAVGSLTLTPTFDLFGILSLIRDVAAAGITGIQQQRSGTEVVFASADQRVTRLSLEGEFLAQHVVNVGDVTGITSCGKDTLIVVGLGLEVLRI